MDGEKKEPRHQVIAGPADILPALTRPAGFSVKTGLQQLVFPESPQAESPFFLVHPGFAYLGGVDVRFRNKGVFRLGSFCWHTRDNADRGDLTRAAAGICWKTSRALLASNPIERRGRPRFY